MKGFIRAVAGVGAIAIPLHCRGPGGCTIR